MTSAGIFGAGALEVERKGRPWTLGVCCRHGRTTASWLPLSLACLSFPPAEQVQGARSPHQLQAPFTWGGSFSVEVISSQIGSFLIQRSLCSSLVAFMGGAR